MTDLPGKWRIFKAVCIIQMTLVLLMLLISVSGVFYGDNVAWRLFETVCYGLMIAFLYLGLNILNDNYPDNSLSNRQRRSFNLLFLANFLMIAFLFAKVIVQWRYATGLLSNYELTARGKLMVLVPLIIAIAVFIVNIFYLAGMYRLRLQIHANTLRQINDDFIKDR
ncbi:MAG: hypothetical protein EOO00_02850 [Chitinophagaceae bacterium]|nr:MAG: hypothetical protein EOO00_02850 [Chitinophagaceae bacterium]